MITLLLACTHTPPQLFPAVPSPPDIAPVVEPAPAPDDLQEPVEVLPGDELPDVLTGRRFVAVPPAKAVKAADWKRYAQSKARAVDACYDGWAVDVRRGNASYAELDAAAVEGRRRESGLRLAVPVAAVLGVALGAGVAVGVAWSFPR